MTLEPVKTKMDYLFYICNAMIHSYLDIGEFKKNLETGWDFFPRWSKDPVDKMYFGLKIFQPPAFMWNTTRVMNNLIETKLGIILPVGFITYHYIKKLYGHFDRKWQGGVTTWRDDGGKVEIERGVTAPATGTSIN